MGYLKNCNDDQWLLGWESDLGKNTARLKSNCTKEAFPHNVTSWKYYVNDSWTESDDIHVEEFDGSELVQLIFATVKF